jgi:hypothetical protein
VRARIAAIIRPESASPALHETVQAQPAPLL